MLEKSGWERAEEGIQVSFQFADSDWKEAAALAVRKTAEEMHTFTVDDVYDRIHPNVQTPNGSALGHLMRGAAKDGIIQKTQDYRRSVRPTRHCAPQPVWRSLVFASVSSESAAEFQFTRPHGAI
jgi:hypothetical protein